MTSVCFDIAYIKDFMVVSSGVCSSSEKILLSPACGHHCGKCLLSDPVKILMPSELFFFSFLINVTLPYIVQWLRIAYVSNKDVRR